MSCVNNTVAHFCGFEENIGSIGVHMKGCGKLGRIMSKYRSVSAYHFALLLSPVVSVWDCIVRKMRYSFRPEWV